MSSAHSCRLHERHREGWTPISHWPRWESQFLGLLEAVRGGQGVFVGVEMLFEGMRRVFLQN